MSPAQRHREGVFRRFADESEVVRCHFAHEGGCRGRLQAAHIISAQRLKREHQHNSFRHLNGQEHNVDLFAVFADDLLADDRNGVPACERHHNLYEGPVLHLPSYPEAFLEFVADFGLEHVVEYARSAA